jgi:hypothetical protein
LSASQTSPRVTRDEVYDAVANEWWGFDRRADGFFERGFSDEEIFQMATDAVMALLESKGL